MTFKRQDKWVTLTATSSYNNWENSLLLLLMCYFGYLNIQQQYNNNDDIIKLKIKENEYPIK